MKVQFKKGKSSKPLLYKGLKLSCNYSHSMVDGGFAVIS